MHASGSKNKCSIGCVRYVSSSTCADSANARSTSPRLSTDLLNRFVPRFGCTSGASGRSASCGSVTGTFTSYFTMIAAAAARASRWVSATTPAITSPVQRVSSPIATNTGQSFSISPTYRSPGTSAAVTTR